MLITLPLDVLYVLHTLQQAGFSAYIVGGAVRDVLMAKDEEPTDWDFTTNATPEQILELFQESFYENDFGTVAVARKHVREQFNLPPLEIEENDEEANYSQVIDLDEATKIHESLTGEQANGMSGSLEVRKTGKMENEVPTSYILHPTSKAKSVFEITTFRSEGLYSDFRRPDQVTWGKTIEEDLKRRDFTINAMAIKLESSIQLPDSSNTQTDKFQFSINNLQKNQSEQNVELEVQTIPSNDDNNSQPTTHNLTLIDPHGGKSDLENRVLRTVGDADERFHEDALRMLRAIRFSVQLDFELDEEILRAIETHREKIQHVSWERIRDEFLKMIASPAPRRAIELLDRTGLLQFILPELLEARGVQQGGHHISDVWTHSLDALHHCPSKDPIVRFATLLHDIAKPQTYRKQDGSITFYNHEIVGSRIAKNIALRFKLSRHDVQRVFLLVRYHMFYYQPENTDASIRRFMRKVGLENINDIIDLRIGDRLGSGSRETSWRLEEMKQRMQDQLHQPFSVHDLKITGHDLMNELNLEPGPILGKILNELFDEVAEEPEKNEKEYLLGKAREIVAREK